MRRSFVKLDSRPPVSLILAGLLFGVGFRAGTANALDGGEGRCDTEVFGELVGVRRVTGDQYVGSQDFWPTHSVLTVSDPGSLVHFALFDGGVRRITYYLEIEAEP